MDRMSGEFATPLIHMEFAASQLSYDNAHNLDRIVSVHVNMQYNQCVMRYISRVFERAAHIERLAPSLIAAGRPIGQVFEWVGRKHFPREEDPRYQYRAPRPYGGKSPNRGSV